MSVFQPPVHPRRVEPVLLPLLRERFPDVRFGSMRSRDNPPLECVIVGDPQQACTPVSQYVRLRVSVWARRDDTTGDHAAAQELAADIAAYLTSIRPPRPVITIAHESGPMRMTDGGTLSNADNTILAYMVLLLTVETT